MRWDPPPAANEGKAELLSNPYLAQLMLNIQQSKHIMCDLVKDLFAERTNRQGRRSDRTLRRTSSEKLGDCDIKIIVKPQALIDKVCFEKFKFMFSQKNPTHFHCNFESQAAPDQLQDIDTLQPTLRHSHP